MGKVSEDTGFGLLDQLKKLAGLENFNPYCLCTKYTRRGLPRETVEQALYDGAVNGYLKWDRSKFSESSLHSYCWWNCIAEIEKVIKQKRLESRYISGSLDARICEDAENNQCAEEDRKIAYPPHSEFFDALTKTNLRPMMEELLSAAFPKKSDKKCLEVMRLYFLEGLSLASVAEKFGYKKQSIHYIRNRGMDFLRKYLASEGGRKHFQLLFEDTDIDTDLLLEKLDTMLSS